MMAADRASMAARDAARVAAAGARAVAAASALKATPDSPEAAQSAASAVTDLISTVDSARNTAQRPPVAGAHGSGKGDSALVKRAHHTLLPSPRRLPPPRFHPLLLSPHTDSHTRLPAPGT